MPRIDTKNLGYKGLELSNSAGGSPRHVFLDNIVNRPSPTNFSTNSSVGLMGVVHGDNNHNDHES